MVAIIFLRNSSIVNFVIEQKYILIGGVFAGLTIVAYFYKIKARNKKIEKIINKILEIMSEKESYAIKEVVNELRADFKQFEEKTNSKFDTVFNMIADLKKDTSLNSLRITMYVSIAVFIIGSVLNIVVK
jgi:formate dehydrogenase maturation protein FdhE